MDRYIIERWYLRNICMLEDAFGVVQYTPKYEWIAVSQFPLPDNWQRFYTRLLIRMPGLYNSIYLEPNEFYIDRGLKTVYGTKSCHIIKKRWYNDLKDEGYARYSFHLVSWNPTPDVMSGDNMVSIVNSLYISLKMLADGKEVV